MDHRAAESIHTLGSGPIVDRYVSEVRRHSRALMCIREDEIAAGIEHHSPAAELDKDREKEAGRG